MKRFSYTLVFFMLFILSGCDDNPTTGVSEEEKASEEKQFVWNGLNLWYYWQSNVPDLADDRFPDERSFHEFLNQNKFNNEEALFNSLLHDDDDFSWFIEDYEEHEKSQAGISQSFGFSFGLVQIEKNNPDIFGYVQYVVEGSPADEAGLKRGDIFRGVNGSLMTINNYQSLLQGKLHYSLDMAIKDGDNYPLTGDTVQVDATELQENPIFMSNVLEAGSSKVGYLVYNAFRFNFHRDLNIIFHQFKSENIDELVLDLRYNGGGALITSAVLAGMISGKSEEDPDDFARLEYNEKQPREDFIFPFFDTVPLYDNEGILEDWNDDMAQLSLNRLFVLTGRGTASASETLINGLRPFMDVILIGEQTVGKDEGSVTLYDAPDNDFLKPDESGGAQVNPRHKRAMQPIVFKIVNSNDANYPDGFTPGPGNFIREIEFLENLPPLGDESEPLLARALDLIGGTDNFARTRSAELSRGQILMDNRDLQPLGKEMYVLPSDPVIRP